MNPEERIEMNQDERDRLHWLKQVKDKKLTQKKAAELMKPVVTGLSDDDIIAISSYLGSLPPQ